MQKPITIALFGAGNVGLALLDQLGATLPNERDVPILVKTIVVQHADYPRHISDMWLATNGIPQKKSTLPPIVQYKADDVEAIVSDPEIDVVVLATNDDIESYRIAKAALKKGKSVVTCERRMIANHLEDVVLLENSLEKRIGDVAPPDEPAGKLTRKPLLYQASVWPALSELMIYDRGKLQSTRGALSSSANFILNKMEADHVSFKDAVADAKNLGLTEKSERLDIEGEDAADRFAVILAHTHGLFVKATDIAFSGITYISPDDIEWAKKQKSKIRLVAHSQKMADGKIAAVLYPSLVPQSDKALFNLYNSDTGLILKNTKGVEKPFKDVPLNPYSASNILIADIRDAAKGFGYNYKEDFLNPNSALTDDFHVHVRISYNSMSDADADLARFDAIEECCSTPEGRAYVIGALPASSLKTEERSSYLRIPEWFEETGRSLILMDDPIMSAERFADYRQQHQNPKVA